MTDGVEEIWDELEALLLSTKQAHVEFTENIVEHLYRLAEETHNFHLSFHRIKAARRFYQLLLWGLPEELYLLLIQSLGLDCFMSTWPWRTFEALEKGLRVKAVTTNKGYLVKPDPTLAPVENPFTRLTEYPNWREASWENMQRLALWRPDGQRVVYVLRHLHILKLREYPYQDTCPEIATKLQEVETAGQLMDLFATLEEPERLLWYLEKVGEKRFVSSAHFFGFTDDATPGNSRKILEHHLDSVRQKLKARALRAENEERERILLDAVRDGLIHDQDGKQNNDS